MVSTSEPPWLTAKVDQRIALMKMHGLVSQLRENGAAIGMLFLSEPPEGATPADHEKWERTCDGCGKFCTDSDVFHVGQVTREVDGYQVLIGLGLCGDCVP